jgi:hypothetical protein
MHTSAMLARWDCLTGSPYHSAFRASPDVSSDRPGLNMYGGCLIPPCPEEQP